MREMRLGAAIRFEGSLPVGDLTITSGRLRNSLKGPEWALGYFKKKAATVSWDPDNPENPFPFKTTLISRTDPDEVETRMSTTREALVYLMALSVPGELDSEALGVSDITSKGAKVLAKELQGYLQKVKEPARNRYATELKVLQRTGLLD